MNKNTIGHRTDSVFEQESLDPFFGIDKLKRRLRRLEALLGLSKDLAVYTNNAAAITGGLKEGDFYRTSTGSLMVVFTP